jgi:hypothetical protein
MSPALSAHGSVRSLCIALVLGCSVYDPSLLGGLGAGSDPQGGQGGQAGDVDPTGQAGSSEDGGDGLGGAGGMNGATTMSGGAGGTTIETGGAAGSATDPGTAGNGGGAGNGGAAGSGGGAGTAGTAGAAGSVPTGGCSAACLLGSGCPSRSCWIASAHPTPPSNYQNIANNRLQPPYAIDGNESTRYTTGAFCDGSEWFQVDLCRTTQIAGLTTYTDTPVDLAASYNIQVSLDGINWDTVLSSSTPPQQRSSVTFAPVLARFVRYNQTGIPQGWWSLGELSVVCAP